MSKQHSDPFDDLAAAARRKTLAPDIAAEDRTAFEIRKEMENQAQTAALRDQYQNPNSKSGETGEAKRKANE